MCASGDGVHVCVMESARWSCVIYQFINIFVHACVSLTSLTSVSDKAQISRFLSGP